MFRTAPAAEPAPEVKVPADLVPLSHLGLDLPAPALGWHAYLSSRDIGVVNDDIGRPCVARSDARLLISEHRDMEAAQAEKRAAAELAAVERDQQRRAQIWGGIPADLIPIGVSPAQAMVAGEKDARPRRESPLQHALSNEGGIVFHPIGPGGDES